MFKYRGSSVDDIPYEIRMDDIHLDDTMVVEFSRQPCEAVIRTVALALPTGSTKIVIRNNFNVLSLKQIQHGPAL